MSDYFRPATLPVARLQHRCIGCGTLISPGTKYQRQTGIFDGRAFVNKLHLTCAAQLDEANDGGVYEFITGDCEPPQGDSVTP